MLTVRQPFASLIISGAKTAELRTWQTPYRGTLLVHAGRRCELTGEEAARAAGLASGESLPRGVLLGRVTLVDCITDHANGRQARAGVQRVWAWLLTNPEPAVVPLPYRGRLGLVAAPKGWERAFESESWTALP